MPLETGRDLLHFPRVVHNLGGGVNGVSYGLLCLTHSTLFYIPEQAVSMQRTGVLTEEYDVSTQKTKTFDGVKLEEVVPRAVAEADDPGELERLLHDMAARITGSCVIPVSEIGRPAIGFFKQLSFLWGNEQYRFSVGGKKQREAVRAFLTELGLA